MPAVKNDSIKRAIAELKEGRRGAILVHSISSGRLRTEFTLIIRPAKDGNEARETATGSSEDEEESAWHVFATNIPPGAIIPDPDGFVRIYGLRWGIETAYRCYEQVLSRTTSRNESVRLLLLFFPLLLYNAWVLARHLFWRVGGRITRMTLKIFSRYLEVLVRESVRRAGPANPG